MKKKSYKNLWNKLKNKQKNQFEMKNVIRNG